MVLGLEIDGPDVGDRIGHLSVLSDQGDAVKLSDVPGDSLVVIFFRGHW